FRATGGSCSGLRRGDQREKKTHQSLAPAASSQFIGAFGSVPRRVLAVRRLNWKVTVVPGLAVSPGYSPNARGPPRPVSRLPRTLRESLYAHARGADRPWP